LENLFGSSIPIVLLPGMVDILADSDLVFLAISSERLMTFETFTIICLIVTIIIGPIYMWLLRNIKNSWTSNSHDTYGGSMTVETKK